VSWDLLFENHQKEILMDRVPEQMFLRGEFLSSLVKQGLIQSPGDLREWVQEMSSLWRLVYPEDSQAAPAAPQARGGGRGDRGGRSYGGTPVDSATIPPADMSTIGLWAGDPIGIGKKICEGTGRPWADTTWGEIEDMVNNDALRPKDWGYMKFLSEKLDNASEKSRTITARAKALLGEDTLHTNTPRGEYTPF
jgi:hypothetical protein